MPPALHVARRSKSLPVMVLWSSDRRGEFRPSLELFADAEKDGPLEPPEPVDWGPPVGAEIIDDDWSDIAPTAEEMRKVQCQKTTGACRTPVTFFGSISVSRLATSRVTEASAGP